MRGCLREPQPCCRVMDRCRRLPALAESRLGLERWCMPPISYDKAAATHAAPTSAPTSTAWPVERTQP